MRTAIADSKSPSPSAPTPTAAPTFTPNPTLTSNPTLYSTPAPPADAADSCGLLSPKISSCSATA